MSSSTKDQSPGRPSASLSEVRKQKYRDAIKRFRLFDDTFMSVVFENPRCAEFLIRIILGNDRLVVTSVKSQHTLSNLHGHSVRLDIYAKDSEGTLYDIEVQRAKDGASPKRARFNSALLDANILPKGDDFKTLPKMYIVFIAENGAFCAGKPIRFAKRVWEDDYSDFGDDTHIVYVNGTYRGNDAIGKLMHDFSCSDPGDMVYPELASEASKYKNEKGEVIVCDIMDELTMEARTEGRAEGEAKGRAEGEAKGRAEGISALVSTLKEVGMTPAVIIGKVAEKFGLSEEEAREAYNKYA